MYTHTHQYLALIVLNTSSKKKSIKFLCNNYLSLFAFPCFSGDNSRAKILNRPVKTEVLSKPVNLALKVNLFFASFPFKSNKQTEQAIVNPYEWAEQNGGIPKWGYTYPKQTNNALPTFQWPSHKAPLCQYRPPYQHFSLHLTGPHTLPCAFV